ncbi:MAG: hypothetical protein O3C60_06740 [Planctomycetota bacterium]|nr:hypothetical protein [Planctomycetota bacterium]
MGSALSDPSDGVKSVAGSNIPVGGFPVGSGLLRGSGDMGDSPTMSRGTLELRLGCEGDVFFRSSRTSRSRNSSPFVGGSVFGTSSETDRVEADRDPGHRDQWVSVKPYVLRRGQQPPTTPQPPLHVGPEHDRPEGWLHTFCAPAATIIMATQTVINPLRTIFAFLS